MPLILIYYGKYDKLILQLGLVYTVIVMIFSILSITLSLLTLHFVIIIHELGHYYAARLSSFMAKEVSIGFGKCLYSWKDNYGTTWSLRLWPFGGYVDFSGLKPKQQNLAFQRLGFLRQSFIIFGGIIANLTTAFILLSFCFFHGYDERKMTILRITQDSPAYESGLKSGDSIISIEDLQTINWELTQLKLIQLQFNQQPFTINYQRQSHEFQAEFSPKNWPILSQKQSILDIIGITPIYDDYSNTIVSVSAYSPAYNLGLTSGDSIIKMNGQAIVNGESLSQWIYNHPGEEVSITYTDGKTGEIKSGNIIIESRGLFRPYGYLGIYLSPKYSLSEIYHPISFSVSESFFYAYQTIVYYISTSFIILYYVISGKMSLSVFSGPIGILIQSQKIISYQHLIIYLRWFSAIHICLAFINLLPIPILDGGQWCMLVIEKLIRKPISSDLRSWIYACCYGLIIGMLVTVTLLDLQSLLIS